MFQRHGGISLRVQGKSCGFWCGRFWLWLRPLSLFALLFPLLAKRKSGRRICVSSLLFLASCWFLICREMMEPRCFIMFLICLPASLNVRTEPQSEIGRNRGEKKSGKTCQADDIIGTRSEPEWPGATCKEPNLTRTACG